MIPRALIVLSLVFFTGCKNDVDTINPTIGTITESVYASGIVKAAGQYNVIPTSNGTLLALLVQEGDTVKAGQPLMPIDDRTRILTTNNASLNCVSGTKVLDDGPVWDTKDRNGSSRNSYVDVPYMRRKHWGEEMESSEFDQPIGLYSSRTPTSEQKGPNGNTRKIGPSWRC